MKVQNVQNGCRKKRLFEHVLRETAQTAQFAHAKTNIHSRINILKLIF